jgi:hypothetical protein
MSSKHWFPAAALLLVAFAPALSPAQTSNPATPAITSTPGVADPSVSLHMAPPGDSSSPESAPYPYGASQDPACTTGPCDEKQPYITIATPAPAPEPWSLQDRIKWLTVVLLVLIAYVAVWLAVSLLRKIERQTRFAEVTAQAAADTAKAVLAMAENQARAERPWILVSTEPTTGITNSFAVVATNRGRSPARIATLLEGTAILADEFKLPAAPVYKTAPRPPAAPIVLLPGETMTIKTFSREEMPAVCESPEQVQRVEEWEERIFFYGNIQYADLVAPSGSLHETGWCCWYIHGRQKSGMIMAGPPEYNRHT